MKTLKVILLLALQGILISCSENKNETFSEYRLAIKDEYQVGISARITKKE